MTLRLAVLSLAFVLLATVGQAEPAPEVQEAVAEGDNDPRIDPTEIHEPPVESDEPAWLPLYRQHSGEVGPGKGADSLLCGGRDACETYKENETAVRR